MTEAIQTPPEQRGFLLATFDKALVWTFSFSKTHRYTRPKTAITLLSLSWGNWSKQEGRIEYSFDFVRRYVIDNK